MSFCLRVYASCLSISLCSRSPDGSLSPSHFGSSSSFPLPLSFSPFFLMLSVPFHCTFWNFLCFRLAMSLGAGVSAWLSGSISVSVCLFVCPWSVSLPSCMSQSVSAHCPVPHVRFSLYVHVGSLCLCMCLSYQWVHNCLEGLLACCVFQRLAKLDCMAHTDAKQALCAYALLRIKVPRFSGLQSRPQPTSCNGKEDCSSPKASPAMQDSPSCSSTRP